MAGWSGAKAKDMLTATAQRVRLLAVSVRLAGQSLEQAANTLEDSTAALDTVENALEASSPLLYSIEVLIGEDIPSTLEVTNQALLSAQASAQAIDRILRALDALSLITGVTYQPEKPMDESLAEVADGLSPLPDALRAAQKDLTSVANRLEEVAPTLVDAQDEFGLLAKSLRRMGNDVSREADSLEAFADVLSGAASRASGWMRGLATVMALLIVWLGLGQAAVFYVGEQLRRESVFISKKDKRQT
jgi:HAMP domain-containing protein